MADTLADVFRRSTAEAATELRGLLDRASKFVFEPATAKLAAEAIARPEEVAAQIPIPDKLTWLEFHGDDRKTGFFFYSATASLRLARCLIVEHRHGGEDVTLTTELLNMDEGGLVEQRAHNRQLLGALALLATPALIERREADQEKLNRQRAKRGKPPLYRHDELRLIDLDLARPQRGEGDGEASGRHGPRRREHFCRAHLRFKRDRMEFVRPHWRGDAKLGHVNPAYRVKL